MRRLRAVVLAGKAWLAHRRSHHSSFSSYGFGSLHALDDVRDALDLTDPQHRQVAQQIAERRQAVHRHGVAR